MEPPPPGTSVGQRGGERDRRPAPREATAPSPSVAQPPHITRRIWYTSCVDVQYANLLIGDPPDQEYQALAESRPEPWGRPPRKLPPPPPNAPPIGQIPEHLLPEHIPATALVKVGEVMGYEVHARREVVERAAHLAKNLGREHWPQDALRCTILALRIGARMSYREIAQSLNMSERHVLRVVRRGKSADVVARELDRLDREGLPMAVENVLDGLERGDKDYTHEYLKGRGVYRQKHETVTDQNAAPAFAGLVVQFVHDGAAGELKAGAIVANPNRALAPGVATPALPAVPVVPGPDPVVEQA